MNNNSQTVAGQTKAENATEALIDAINQCFTLFRLNYHNQYVKAYSNNIDELNHVKRLWLEMLGCFKPTTILLAAKSIIESSDYLPTLHTMIRHCEKHSHHGKLPDAHSAYIEACRAPSPKREFTWSHPIIYFTGKACDWYFLQNNSEKIAYPVFKHKYEEFCTRMREGEVFIVQHDNTITQQIPDPLDKKENLKRLEGLKAIIEDTQNGK